MKDIGRVHFPITTKNPEVQKWFDQGITLLHSFWDYEAERAFRWCLKLEPDNAMAFWGLARASSGSRSAEFVREAAKRKEKVSERERLYIEALEALTTAEALRDRGAGYWERNRDYKQKLESICIKYPKDMEARALLALANMGDSRYGTEQIIQEILAVQSDHPGAHHYRIHNWNYHEPEQALESCRRYGEIAPGIGHALHMPGHIYATVGMWNEAAIAMDAATRVEIRHMTGQLVFPYNYWNYGHNRNYLSYIQEQLGMADAAIFAARQLMEAPLDPKFNAEAPYSAHSQGIHAMVRALVKFERWNDLLDPTLIPWRDIFTDKALRAYAETRAYLGKGDVSKAERALEKHSELKKELDKNKNAEEVYNLQADELKARLELARGETLEGLGHLSQAAQKQFEIQKSDNDPPRYPQVLYVSLGREYMRAKSPHLAVAAFEKALKLTRNDIFALAGLVEAHHSLGDREKATTAMERLLYLTSGADKGLSFLERAKATGISASPKDSSPAPQRDYRTVTLDRYGPTLWQPYAAPRLEARDHEGKMVTLDEFKGKNVILVFYLGKECLHCMQQLQQIAKKSEAWSRLDTVVLAISGNQPEANAEYLKNAKLPGVRVLSDSDFSNAKRFRSYDDFEEMELHSTILIDSNGRVHWARTGGEPFRDMGFLEKQLDRMNKLADPAAKTQVAGR
jgi:peroxiredoxin